MLIVPGEEVREALRYIRTVSGTQFDVVIGWLKKSLDDQRLTNEATTNPNVLLHGSGQAACIEAIVRELTRLDR